MEFFRVFAYLAMAAVAWKFFSWGALCVIAIIAVIIVS
jgi:hypothetical protein